MAENPKPARDDVLRRMLKTPPAPHKPIGKRKKADLEATDLTELEVGDPKDRPAAEHD